MAPEKVTDMVLNVDLKCSVCYKKVKKVIGKIPQIRDQLFHVEKNKVKIVVVCCSPEKIRDKLCYKGGGAIQSIEIIEKSDHKPEIKPKPGACPPAGQRIPPAKPPTDPGKPLEPAKVPKEGEKPKEVGPPKEAPKKAEAGPNPNVAKMLYEPVHGYYPQMNQHSGYPMLGYGQYHDQGYGDAPYQHGYAMQVAPPPPPPTFGGFGYEHGYNRYNANKNHYMSNDYGDEGYEESCSIM